MSKCAFIVLKSGKDVVVEDFKYITYPGSSDSKVVTKVEDIENFYLYTRLLTFVGETTCVSIHSNNIEYVKFDS